MSDTAPSVACSAVEVTPAGDRTVETSLPVETPLVVEVNGRPVAILLTLPGMERELAIGFCLGEGLIASFSDILLVHHCREETSASWGSQSGLVVRLQARAEAVRQLDRGTRLVLSGCGGTGISLETLQLPRLALPEEPLLRREALWPMARALRRAPQVYRRSGGVHAAGLFALDSTSLVLAEDIGRHNAADKVLGAALLRGLALCDKVLLTTGRASHELVAKGLRLGVPVVGSLSSPTSLAVELAERGGCTLAGRLRRQKCLVYAHPGRIR